MTMRGGSARAKENKYFDMSRELLRASDFRTVSTNVFAKPGCSLAAVGIQGMSRAWEEGDAAQLHRRISNALTGLAASRESFAFVTASDGLETGFYLCPGADREAVVKGAFSGVLEDVRYADSTTQVATLVTRACGSARERHPATWGGCMRGMPAVPKEGEKYLNPVDTIITGMKGSPFIILTLCMPTAPQTVAEMQQVLYRLMDTASREEQYSIASTSMDGRTITVTDYACKRYLAELERIGDHLNDARDCGGWSVMTLFAAGNETAAKRLAALLSGAYSGANAGPEPVRCHHQVNQINNMWIPGVIYPDLTESHPLGVRGSAYTNPVLTPMSSMQLASLLMLPDKEQAGFFVNEEARFDLTCRTPATDASIELGNILRSAYSDDAVGRYPFPQEDFSRHVLVAGATGGGKSNTIRSILRTLHAEKGVPFMVIESAKSEYWQLSAFTGFEKLCVMSLGEMNSPFRLNPFECTAGFSLQTHVDALLSTFKAAFDMYTPMPFILEQAVYEVYRDYGWDVATGRNDRSQKQYPTLADLYWQIPETVAGTAYDKEIRDNVTGALQTRVKSLMIGGKGVMLNVRQSTPLDKLLTLPVVLELESLGDDETKAFVIGLMMNRLYEFRRVKSAGASRDFEHLLIIEEAHRLLKRVSPAENSSSAASVEFFCNMLSEIRSYGQGIMIADQSPMKLAQDAVRNTNLKIVHRMVDFDDRQAVGGAMHMNDGQREALSMLRRGVGAVYSEGDNRPKLVKFPLVRPARALNRAGVLAKAERVLAGTARPAAAAGDAGCAGCRYWSGAGCRARMAAANSKQIAEFALGPDKKAQQADYLQRFDAHGPNPQLVDAIIDYGIQQYAKRRGGAPTPVDRRCVAGHLVTALFSADRQMAELVTTRYSNYLERKK